MFWLAFPVHLHNPTSQAPLCLQSAKLRSNVRHVAPYTANFKNDSFFQKKKISLNRDSVSVSVSEPYMH